MKTFKLFAMITAIALFTFSCKKDDDNQHGPHDETSTISELVPKGTIVPLSERNATLTGSNESTAARTTATQKWWELEESAHVITFNVVCDGVSVPDNHSFEPLDEDDRRFVAFSNNGNILQSKTSDGTGAIVTGTWKWVDENKNAIEITSEDEDEPGETNVTVYQLTWLDSANLVYVYIGDISDGISSSCTGGMNVYVQSKAVE